MLHGIKRVEHRSLKKGPPQNHTSSDLVQRTLWTAQVVAATDHSG